MDEEEGDQTFLTERLVHLRHCYQSLSEDNRNLLSRRYDQSESIQHIATQLSRTVGAVKVKLHIHGLLVVVHMMVKFLGLLMMVLVMDGQLPSSLDDLLQPVDGRSPLLRPADVTDPWGHRLNYEVGVGREFELFSSGPDGVPGTADDVRTDESGTQPDGQ